MDRSKLNRREYLALAGAAAAAAATGGLKPGIARGDVQRAAAAPTVAARKRLLRVAHITDIHVFTKLDSDRGFAKCLNDMQGQADPPEMILNGGDCVMDSTRAPAVSTDKQWDIWKRVWKNECSLPAAHVLGNHDVWGWDKKKSATTGSEPKWGKGKAMDALGMTKLYHSFDRGGWHFIGLDTVHPLENATPDVFTARLDEAQWAWLQADLAKLDPKTPVLIFSHIPIFSMVPIFNNQVVDTGPRENLIIDRSDMLTDYHRLKELFKRHRNVKACLSGHIHLVDRVDYLGVSYLCGGAVCGAWWRGARFDECAPGYSLIDLYDDGSVERQYVEYGWVPVIPQTKPANDHPEGANTTRAKKA
jgi:3',5'-cyclic AMP phosphodiesterase CpdA